MDSPLLALIVLSSRSSQYYDTARPEVGFAELPPDSRVGKSSIFSAFPYPPNHNHQGDSIIKPNPNKLNRSNSPSPLPTPNLTPSGGVGDVFRGGIDTPGGQVEKSSGVIAGL